MTTSYWIGLDTSQWTKFVDTFVTDRSFEDFCQKQGNEINMALIDPAMANGRIRCFRNRQRRDGASGTKARSRNQKMQLRKENSRQRLFQTCETLSSNQSAVPASDPGNDHQTFALSCMQTL
jgi:hypothetical protein